MTLKQIFILLMITLSAGCTPKPSIDEISHQYIDWSKETPESVHTRITTSAKKIDILTAFFSLSMNPPPEKMMSSLSGVITIDSRSTQPKVRIQAFHLFGSTLFDMVNTGITKIYVPRKNTMYISEEGQQETDTNGPQTIFANMMLEPSDLVLTGRKLEINEKSVTLFVEKGWLNIDKINGQITLHHKNEMDISYSAYQTMSNGSRLPTQINIVTIDGTFKAKCTLSQISLPESLPETFFNLNEYQPKTIENLQDLP